MSPEMIKYSRFEGNIVLLEQNNFSKWNIILIGGIDDAI